MAENNNFNGVVQSLLSGMNTIMSSKTVVGEATKVGDTIVLPLVDVSFGVAAGATSADKKDGGCGGFGAKMSPSAVLVIKDGSTKLVNIKNQDAVTKILDLVPDVVDRFTKKDDIMDSDDAVNIAFPEKSEEK
jgi:uncharacterized spore protein YtfJ